MSPWACMLTFIISKIHLEFWWACFEGKGPWNHNAGVSWNKGLCGFVCFSWSTTARHSQIAHACNFSLCHHYYNTLAVFSCCSLKIFWLDGLCALSRNWTKTIKLREKKMGFLRFFFLTCQALQERSVPKIIFLVLVVSVKNNGLVKIKSPLLYFLTILDFFLTNCTNLVKSRFKKTRVRRWYLVNWH